MKVQNNAKLSSILVGDFVGGDWRGDQIPKRVNKGGADGVFSLLRVHLVPVRFSLQITILEPEQLFVILVLDLSFSLHLVFSSSALTYSTVL